MILNDFRTIIRAKIPSAKTSVVSNAFLDLLINKGVEDVNVKIAAYSSDKKFDVVAEQDKYPFSTYIDDFVCWDEGGLWWNDGDADDVDWKRLDGMTRRSLNDSFPKWMSDSSDSPLRYISEGDNLTIHPKPDTALTSGFWAFYIMKPVTMTDSGHYPFSGSTTEITSLSMLDDAIIDYVRWKIAPALGKDAKGVLAEEDYLRSVAECSRLFHRRLDITGNNRRMRGPTIG